MSDVVVTDNPEQHRFEARLDGELAGYAEYALRSGTIVFLHTEVDPAYEGKGVGSAIVRSSLDAVRAAGDRDVIPSCPFYARWISEHADYADLLHERHRTQA